MVSDRCRGVGLSFFWLLVVILGFGLVLGCGWC